MRMTSYPRNELRDRKLDRREADWGPATAKAEPLPPVVTVKDVALVVRDFAAFCAVVYLPVYLPAVFGR
jgi:hypothetical protein